MLHDLKEWWLDREPIILLRIAAVFSTLAFILSAWDVWLSYHPL